MKTIIRIGTAVQTTQQIGEAKLNPLAVKLLAESFSTQRDKHEEAVLVIESGKDGQPVYMTLGSRPPELAVGDRRVWAVFAPPESQEPVATFSSKLDAQGWAENNELTTKVPFSMGEIDATDKPVCRVSVSVMAQRMGKVLMVKLLDGSWTFPEGTLEVGDSTEGAARRVLARLGLIAEKVGVCAGAPYVNAFFQMANQHIVSLCMICDGVKGEARVTDKSWVESAWFPIGELGQPLFVIAQQFSRLLQKKPEKKRSKPSSA